MLRRLLLPFALGLATLFAASAAQAATAARTPHVKASLVAADASVQPGKPITLALRLQHDPHWHTYWQNPGTGLPTELKWDLPPGWQAGPIQWPAPILLKDKSGNVVGNGYEGDTLLPLTLTAPADAKPGPVELKVAAEWLECEAICVPGSAKLTFPLTVGPDAPKPDATWGGKIRSTVAGLPRTDANWKVTAARDGKNATLTVTPAGAGPTHKPQGLHFFNTDTVIAYDQPQTVTPDGRGGFVLTLKLSDEAPADAKALIGVLTSTNGWHAQGTLRGLAVDTPFSGPLATLAPTSGGTSSAQQTSAAAGTAAAAAGPATSLLTMLGLAFVGGLILNLMPCVFPVIGIKILGFVNQAGHERAKVIAHGLIFTVGVLLSFWVLAGLLTVLGGGRGWGYQLQIPGFVFSVAIVMLVFAMSLSGVFEFGLSATAVGGNLQMKSGYAGTFFTGILATVVATPCSAPFLATALGATLSLAPVEKFAVFTAIGLGLSTPYLLLSMFPAAVKILPRPGAWMETFKQLMAFPLYATVAYLVWVLAGQTSDEGFRGVLFGLVLVAMAVWIYGRWTAPGASAGRARFGVGGLIAVGAFGLWLGWPQQMEANAQRAPGAVPEIVWQPWSPEAVAKLRDEGRIVYVDFTARWCATCQTNKKLVFSSSDVLRTFDEKKIVTLRADWTNQDSRITAELAKYQRAAVPFNLIWIPGKADPVLLPEVLTPGIVLDALKQNAPGALVTAR
ncbi:MAG: protein-disulfide reductase DsbD domain-containing protein [Verrucomicrobiota bacterium]